MHVSHFIHLWSSAKTGCLIGVLSRGNHPTQHWKLDAIFKYIDRAI